MKFNRIELINTLENRIAEAHATANKDYSEAVKEYEAAKERWLNSDHGQYFLNEADKLKEKAFQKVITTEDLEPFEYSWSSSYARHHVFSAKLPTPPKVNTDTLIHLLVFLKTVTDDEVSSSGLRDVGFRNIAQILRSVN